MRAFCLSLSAVLTLAVLACESTPDRTAGGRAFGDSYLSRRLDSGNPNLTGRTDREGNTIAPSYNQWREGE